MNFPRRKAVLMGVAALILVALGLWGPIPQFAKYHHFADQTSWLGIPHAADVLSNVLFLLPGVSGLVVVSRFGQQQPGRAGYLLFFASLTLTALGSGWYHLEPNNVRLAWDRLPIALACAGILDAVVAEQCGVVDVRRLRPLLWAWAPLSVLWWYWSEFHGAGDLRPYLFLQGLPLLMIPLLLVLFPSTRISQLGLGGAILAYVVAKGFELADHQVLEMTGCLSGHTVKHVFAALAGGAVVWMLRSRNENAPRLSGAGRQAE